ncbi:MAG: hypothetical protein FJ241_03645 [Nitrospira sp.]|nr:hypothetical protein [Nitrospira sp.]
MNSMQDKKKTKEQLLNELLSLRKKLVRLEKSTFRFQKAEEILHKRLIEYEKLTALGRLTANVAHEIRNPITVIGGFTERLKKSVPQGTQENEYVEMISSEVKRLEEILRDVLVFTNKPFFLKKEENMNRIVNESLRIFKDMFRNRSISVQKYFKDVTQVYVDRRQVKEAMNNLISNAVDTMSQGGILTIATNEASIRMKNYVTVSVSDTGAGIPEEHLRLIFEPFYSTKVTKHETGLGLPIIKKIVEGHGGFIKIDSKVGRGSTFSLFFPYRSR